MRAITIAISLVLVLGVSLPAPTLATKRCLGSKTTIVGTKGDDVIHGTPGPDVIRGNGGDDDIDGGRGDDRICGGPGDDTIRGGKGDDTISGDGDADRIRGGRGDDAISGGGGADRIRGGRGDDRIRGRIGADILLGNAGHDSLHGDHGDDRLDGGVGRDLLIGDGGNDRGGGNDRLDGGPGQDVCVQGDGSGREIRCETRYADLAMVALDCPASVTLDVSFECDATIANLGPAAAHYVIEKPPVDNHNCGGSCQIFLGQVRTYYTVDHPAAGVRLAAGDERIDTVEVTITRWPTEPGEDGRISVRVRPIDHIDAVDREQGNDRASTTWPRP